MRRLLRSARRGENDDVAARLAYADFLHPVERGSFRQGDWIACQTLANIGEIGDLNKEPDVVRAALRDKLRRIFANTLDSLKHDLGSVANQNGETEDVAFWYFGGFHKTHAIDPKRE